MYFIWYESLSEIHWAIYYQVSAIGSPTIYVHEPSPIVLVVRVCVKSPTSDMTWPDNVFISEVNPHLISWFCGVVLGPTTISKMVSEWRLHRHHVGALHRHCCIHPSLRDKSRSYFYKHLKKNLQSAELDFFGFF